METTVKIKDKMVSLFESKKTVEPISHTLRCPELTQHALSWNSLKLPEDLGTHQAFMRALIVAGLHPDRSIRISGSRHAHHARQTGIRTAQLHWLLRSLGPRSLECSCRFSYPDLILAWFFYLSKRCCQFRILRNLPLCFLCFSGWKVVRAAETGTRC